MGPKKVTAVDGGDGYLEVSSAEPAKHEYTQKKPLKRIRVLAEIARLRGPWMVSVRRCFGLEGDPRAESPERVLPR